MVCDRVVSERGLSFGDESVRVAPDRVSTPRFDAACALAIGHLARVAPLGMWAVTRVVNGQQLMLAIDAPAYDIVAGSQFPFADSICRFMVSGAAPQIAPRVEDVADYAAATAIAPIPVRAYLGAPIVWAGGELFGTVCGYDPHTQPDSLHEHQQVLELVSGLLSAVLEADTIATTSARELELARRASETDSLTALLNRRGWDQYLLTEERRYRRFGDQACVIVVDLDQLKIVNDTYGHAAGDHYIRRAARALAASVRAEDVVARLGGDEFGIIAVGASPTQTGELVTRLEDALRRAGIEACVGYAPYHPATGFPGAWDAADQAMYQRKRQKHSTSVSITGS
jgi:diguanylate cyclase (GGDEF)-like protein